jgi:hypothetical protein
MPRRGQETASERGISTDKIALVLVVVQAVAGSSPVAHPHEVAAQNLLLRQRHSDSARAELPMSYQFFGAAVSSSSSVSPGLRV